MTDIKNHVPDLETCRKLKEAGYPQQTYFYWRKMGHNSPHLTDFHQKCEPALLVDKRFQSDTFYAAPLATDIMKFFDFEHDWEIPYEKLPAVNIKIYYDFFECVYSEIVYNADDEVMKTMGTEIDYADKNPATACALMWLKLKEEGKL